MKDREQYLNVKDHSVSGENFQLLYNAKLDMLETHPQPALGNLPNYYKSDDYISHTDSKRNMFEYIYQFVKTIALKRKLKLINGITHESNQLLDVGCGTGDFLKIAEANSWNICGIEPNEKARKIANEKTNQSVYEIEHLSNLDTHSFDVITLWHVLEHLPNLDQQIQTFKKLLKPSGRLIIAVPNFKSYDAEYYKSFWAAYDVPRHLWHFSKDAIAKLVAREQMIVEKHVPMIFDSYYVSLLSEKYKSGYMNLFRALWNGWKSNWKAKRSGEYSSLIYIIKNA